ncbi:MAG: hypothetical protein ORN58_05740, partial [Sediminibacterium sp.]|nr:hypothetical protein [Sediminibacterium sp.]
FMRFIKIYLLGAIVIFLSFFTNAQTNAIKGVISNTFKTNTRDYGGNIDHIQLPPLNLSGPFTIETWFKSNTNILNVDFGVVRIFDFGSGSGENFKGAYLEYFDQPAGGNRPLLKLQMGVQYNIQIYYDYIVENIINPLGWNHFAVMFTGDSFKLYANGVIVGRRAQNTGFDSSYFRSNFIGRCNFSLNPSTMGEYKDFRIWKTARTDMQIKNNYLFPLNVELDSANLYYYLPLTKNNLYKSTSIPNQTTLTNASIWSQANTLPSTIISLNNVSAKYNYDSNNQQLYGDLASSTINNELIEYSINNGTTWKKIDTAINNKWGATLPTNFIYGNIQVRSDNIPRTFANYRYDLIPVVSYSPNFSVNNAGTQANLLPPTILYSALNNDAIFSITNGGNNDISINSNTGQITLSNNLPVGIYNLTIAATNTFGVSYHNFTIYNGNTYTINTQVSGGGSTSPSGFFSINQFSQEFIYLNPN